MVTYTLEGFDILLMGGLCCVTQRLSNSNILQHQRAFGGGCSEWHSSSVYLLGRVYFKDFFGLHNTPVPSYPLPYPPVPSLPIPSTPLPFLPLEVGPLNPARVLGERSPSEFWGGAPAEFWVLVHFSPKI